MRKRSLQVLGRKKKSQFRAKIKIFSVLAFTQITCDRQQGKTTLALVLRNANKPFCLVLQAQMNKNYSPMKNEITLIAAIRKEIGSAAVKRLRKAGRVVGVLYGKKTSPLPLELPAPEITKLLRDTGDEHLLVNLSIEGSDKPTRLALVQDVQHNPLSGDVLHVDFHEVAAEEKIRISVHIATHGEPVGVKTGGGILETVLREVTVECLPADLPHNITLDVSHLNIGQAIHIGDIKPPEGVTILGNPNAVVVTVAAPTVAAAEATAEQQTATEPEVSSGKGKKPAEAEEKK